MHFNEVKFQDPRTKTYLGSPSILRLPDGGLLATHDYFGPGCPKNHEGEEHLTSVYRSYDEGTSWHNLTHISGAFWSSLFEHRGAIYLLGTSAQYGHIVIRLSEDGGCTWTHPLDERSGLLFRGGPYHDDPNYHCAPVPVLEHNGRLYRAFEDCAGAQWGRGFQSCVISAEIDADLLNANHWRMSNKLAYDQEWDPPDWGDAKGAGWLEGNVVMHPSGELWNILRVNSKPVVDKAAIVKIHDEGRYISFDPATGFLDFPGGMSKFTIRRDPRTSIYWTFTNNNTNRAYPNQRNVLSLYCSADLLDWEHVQTLLEDDQDLPEADSMYYTGFQYVDWQFDGDDLIYLVRTAYRGAHSFHDANRIVFDKVIHFRKLTPPPISAIYNLQFSIEGV